MAWWFAIVSGCVDYEVDRPVPRYPDPHPVETGPAWIEDRIVQAVTPVVDVLFVVDNSCSMEDDQASLTSNFSRFMDYFVGSGVDYHVGVVATDLDGPQFQGRLQSARGYLYLDPDTVDPNQVFRQMASLGTSGSGTERGLGATYLALAVDRDTFNAGFYRDTAALHTVVVSDEQDQTQDVVITEDEFIDWYGGLKRDANDRTFSSIVTLAGPDAGTRYLDVTEEIGGTSWDIAQAQWDVVLGSLGSRASGIRQEFFLSRLPVVDTLDVAIELPDGTVRTGFSLDSGAGGDYRYDRSRNSVAFVELVPDPLSTVVIRYEALTDSRSVNARVTVAR